MTRHGMVEPSAAGAPPPATDLRAPMVTVAADRLTTSSVQDRLSRAKAGEGRLSALTSALPSVGRADTYIGTSSKSP